MKKTIETMMSKINLILLFGLCLGFSRRLYAVGNDKNNALRVRKTVGGQLYGSSYGYNSNPMLATPQSSIYRNNMSSKPTQVGIWNCKSIEKCSALLTVIGCLQYWQQLNNFDQLKSIFSYLSRGNHYMNIVGAYHHLLDKHLCNNGKKEFKYISTKARKVVQCNFKMCKCYMRNQRERGKEANKADQAYDNAYIFLRDLLDTMHVYLMHSCDTGHRCLESYTHAIKDDDKKDVSDLQLKKLQRWQADIKKQQRDQDKRGKFQTKVYEVKKVDEQKISLALLKEKFGNNNAFKKWIQYLEENECDTDNIVAQVLSHEKETVIPIDKAIFKVIKNCIEQKQDEIERQNKQQQTNRLALTGLHRFGIRLYYWKYYLFSDKEEHCLGINYRPRYRQKDLYVYRSYLYFKKALLHLWNKKPFPFYLLTYFT